ncbi:MAG TPA: class I SAM-dependent RNA methyltransferase [Candidatus Limadaptatus stercoripullorum]|uniref:Class I SAM-dependent RNA methyltransferase n=1 Tax=Candidatus Limadaptatus stercoripullorum TaxID=2840846 RepID=A0A9D1NBF0_9FIRM|nr:class I SAM-dependent RNA methyltransferase [Candidatus Limadaptatus stercoripullorum]
MSFFDGRFFIEAAAASGTEAALKRELVALGYEPSGAEYGRIRFQGDMRDAARANVFLRTAGRVRIELARFPARSFDELYDGVRALPWRDIMGAHAALTVTARSIHSTLFSLSDIQRVTKKAAADSLAAAYGLRTLPEDGVRYSVEAGIADDVLTLALDTSGEGLHKRGYRTLVGAAPIRETLAASIIAMSFWRPDRAFADPFTGSGTFPIEAAMIAAGMAPGENRHFAFERFEFAPPVLRDVLEEARAGHVPSPKADIVASDISADAIKMARLHAKKAGVDGLIRFSVADAADFVSDRSHGVLFANPPYGERLMGRRELEEMCRGFGRAFSALDEWSAFVITSMRSFEKYFGRKADKKRTLYNSEIECSLLRFPGAPPAKEDKK